MRSGDLDEKGLEVEQLCRMRRLVLESSEGSKLYDLSLLGEDIGKGGVSAVKALAAVLMEKVREKDVWVTRCCDLQLLDFLFLFQKFLLNFSKSK